MKYKIKLVVLVFFPFLAVAQTDRQLSIQEALTLGVDNSKQMKLSAAKTQVFHEKVSQLYNTLIPSLSLSSGYTRLSDNITPFTAQLLDQTTVLNPQILNQYSNRVSAQQVLFAGGRGNQTLQQARQLESASRLDAEKDKPEIRFQVASVYLNLYKLQSSLQMVEENRKLFEQRLTDSRNLEKQGLALSNDVLKLDLSLSSLEVSKAEIEQNIGISSFNLALLTGLPTETRFTLSAIGLFDPKITEAEPQLLAKALEQRAEIKAARSRKQASESGIKAAKANYYPVISAGANYYLNRPNVRQFPQDDQFRNTWDFGVNLSYNLQSVYNTKSAVREAQATASQADIQVAQLQDALRMEVKSSLSAYTLSLKKVELAQKTIVQARENQRVLQKRVKSESAMLSEVAEADVAVANAQLSLISAQTDAELAWYKLKKSLGE